MTISPSDAHDVAVYIGRFQPFHAGHAAVLRHALSIAPRCVVVLGSAHQARSPRNPFTWQERAEMIRLTLSDAERERLQFLPMRDYYDEDRWVHAVHEAVHALTMADIGATARTVLVGHFKDASSGYLRGFPGWTLASVARNGSIDAAAVRDAYFGSAGGHTPGALAALASQLPPTTMDFLRAWAGLPMFEAVAEEWRMLRKYHAAWAAAPYPPVFVTVDTLIRCAGHVLLIERSDAPGKGLYAVPGGFIERRETVYQSALRELHEETGLSLLDTTMRQTLKEVAVFDHPDRSQRGRTITHAHYFDFGDRELPELRAGDDAASAEWIPVARLAAMEDRFFDDHFHMLDHFLGLTPDSSAN